MREVNSQAKKENSGRGGFALAIKLRRPRCLLLCPGQRAASVLLVGHQAHDSPVLREHLRAYQNPEHGKYLQQEILGGGGNRLFY